MDFSADLWMIMARVRNFGRVAILVSLGVATCISLPLFLAAATFVLLFIILPLFLLFGAPFQVVRIVLDAFSARKNAAPMEIPLRARSRSGLTRHGSRSATSTRSSSRRIDFEAPAVSQNPSGSHSAAQTPKSILGLTLTDGAETTGASTTMPTGAPEANSFVESPLDYFQHRRTSPLEQLSGELLEEIARHLPERSLSTLALVSKRFGTQFRFRRLHSGTEHCALPTFLIIKKEPRLGEYTTRVVVHESFFRPPAKVQWLLDGSEQSVAIASWKSTEIQKQNLLEGVLRACPRIRSLIWNDGQLPLNTGILNAVHALCSTSLRHLSISVDSRLINHLNESLAPESLRLDSLTLRGGFSAGSSSAIIGFFLLSKTIRQVRLLDANFGVSREDARIVLSVLLQEHSSIKSVHFVRPHCLEPSDIPIKHTCHLIMECASFLAEDVQAEYHQFQFRIPTGSNLSNLTALLFQTHCLPESIVNPVGGAGFLPPEVGVQNLCDVVSASPNLRIFSLNAERVVGAWGVVQDTFRPRIPENLLSALTSKTTLVSLSLMAFTLSREQLQVACGSLCQLRHFGIFMEGDVIEISTYSQNFSKLLKLIALDVIVRPTNKCPCGHESDSRIPHQDEGTAMGRLCRRIRPPMALTVVRMSQGNWSSRWSKSDPLSEIRWIGPFGMGMKRLEALCGPCETDLEMVHKVFDPVTWLDVA